MNPDLRLAWMRSVAVERHVVFYRAFGPEGVILRVLRWWGDAAAMGVDGVGGVRPAVRLWRGERRPTGC